MNDHWLTTGDDKSYSEVRGWIHLKEDDMSHWQALVLDNIRAIKNQKMIEYVERNPYITIGALFFRGWNIKQEDFDLFVKEVCAELGDVKPILCDMDLGKKRKRNIISISFASGSIQDCFSKTKRADLRLQSILSSRKQ